MTEAKIIPFPILTEETGAGCGRDSEGGGRAKRWQLFHLVMIMVTCEMHLLF